MRRVLCVGVILLLGFGAWTSSAEAQSGTTGRDRGFQLQQNYPNPFNPVTRIPFGLGGELFEPGQAVRVTIRIYSVLRELVAIPTALNHPQGNRTAIDKLEYPGPGNYVAYWDGLDRDGRKVASGIYYVLLEVNGKKAAPLPITVAK